MEEINPIYFTDKALQRLLNRKNIKTYTIVEKPYSKKYIYDLNKYTEDEMKLFNGILMGLEQFKTNYRVKENKDGTTKVALTVYKSNKKVGKHNEI